MNPIASLYRAIRGPGAPTSPTGYAPIHRTATEPQGAEGVQGRQGLAERRDPQVRGRADYASNSQPFVNVVEAITEASVASIGRRVSEEES
jgi:hypothetical protein